MISPFVRLVPSSLPCPRPLYLTHTAAAGQPLKQPDAVLCSAQRPVPSHSSSLAVQPSPMPVSLSKPLSHAAPPAHEAQLTELEGTFAAQRARVACLRHSAAVDPAAPRQEALEATLAAATTEADKTALRLLNGAITADNPDRVLQLVSACVPMHHAVHAYELLYTPCPTADHVHRGAPARVAPSMRVWVEWTRVRVSPMPESDVC